MVDPPGIEPGPDPCHGSVMPIYYGPKYLLFEYYRIMNNFSRKKPVGLDYPTGHERTTLVLHRLPTLHGI